MSVVPGLANIFWYWSFAKEPRFGFCGDFGDLSKTLDSAQTHMVAFHHH